MSVPESMRDRLSLPLVGAPLFIISNPDLVIAQCKAGVVGSFPALNARPVEVLDQWLTRINEELDAYNQDNPDEPAAPYAVNQIVHGSNDRLMHDVELCVKYKVPVVITSLGARPGRYSRQFIRTVEFVCMMLLIINSLTKRLRKAQTALFASRLALAAMLVRCPQWHLFRK